MAQIKNIELKQLEKIRTGQSFLYRKHGFESMVIEIKMKDRIDQSCLEKAAEKSFQRFDYLTQSFYESAGDFYLIENRKPLNIRRSATLLPLGGRAVNYHLIDLHFWQSKIFISYHHGLCDGRGIMPFVRTILYYYSILRYDRLFPDVAVQKAGSPYLVNELKEPGFVEIAQNPQAESVEIIKNGYSLPEAAEQETRLSFSYKTALKINNQSLLSYSKSIGATPALAFALLFAKAINNQRPASEMTAVNCNLIVDLRAGAGLENSFRNCVSSLSLNFEAGDEKAAEATIKRHRQQLNDYKKQENLQQELGKIQGLSNQLDLLDNFRAKQAKLSFFDNLLSDTFILSYIGKIDLGEIERKIESIHTYTSGTRGLSIEILATNDAFFIDIMQSFSNSDYLKQLLEIFNQLKIEYELEATEKISVPRDRCHMNEIK
ncbi:MULTISPECIES: hypothetical protein [unclassified Enterococcus]|uniref:hypothetical protein n=1 Tax=unclassified Enterococcus TaxID=2608891 RepID=UPI0015542795|nr:MULTISPECIES: hypothetical protein [unclassified Enterococcus]MBS7578227.1 hypothetical protein [Enterococcus sp. MMGLQ5-2]MBS7585534.1 hypothetical protein [Enterococcus sp. MMGLQ5-1]NPD13393.1 hypothetical protein [Enterococcus sp. MMGLQ5-1]NPD38058.1 hypothetical protein [Enterococcus sp. MMGLQ5-2]